MKRFWLWATCASVALASCVNEEKIDELAEVKKAISFSAPVVGANSRIVTGEIGVNYDTNEQFKVSAVHYEGSYTAWETHFAASTEGLFMNKVPVHWTAVAGTNGTWEPATEYYWPLNKKVTFSAFSPADATSDGTFTNSNAGLTITDFTIKDDPAEQYDLMFSDLSIDNTSASGSSEAYYEGVDIAFNHALSSIHFKAKKQGDFTAVIKNITLEGFHNKGTFTQNLSVDNNDGNALHHTYGNPQWERTADKKDYEVYDDATGFTLTEEPQTIGSSMILMPQIFSTGISASANAEAKLYITYKVGSNPENTFDIKLSELSEAWTMGVRYTYTIVLGGNNTIQKITFAPTVDPWDATGGGNVNI